MCVTSIRQLKIVSNADVEGATCSELPSVKVTCVHSHEYSGYATNIRWIIARQ
jgi:hypothetical protein